MTPTNEEVRLRLYAATHNLNDTDARTNLDNYVGERDQSDRLLTTFLTLERERPAGLVEALVKVAIPLEAMNLIGQKTLGMGDDIWIGVQDGITAVRAALKAYNALKGEG